jgi:hypothetical protein
MAFIVDHRYADGVEPICCVRPIAHKVSLADVIRHKLVCRTITDGRGHNARAVSGVIDRCQLSTRQVIAIDVVCSELPKG